MGPYRSNRQSDLRESPREGLVADMVKQFADPFAFLRELVQNAIDAGASQIRVRVSQRPDGAICTSVYDDGCGMTLETIEGPFLTLFASSKEGVAGKIGKYGVGFMSVFGPAPAQVVVETWRAEGSYVITLERDFSYVVRSGVEREGHGTRVEQLILGKVEAFADHADRVARALRRWCRHATCPILLDVVDADGRFMLTGHRIDVALSIACPVTAQQTIGDTTIVVGYEAGCAFLPDADRLLEGSGAFAGFYNRGLTLYESTTECLPGLEGIRCKVVSPALQHTLSRDNVRRDEAFAALVHAAGKLARETLPSLLQARIAERAEQFARTTSVPADYMAVLVAATAHLDRARISLPLVEPVAGQLTMPAARIVELTPDDQPCLTAASADEVTHAFAAMGRPIVRVGPAGKLLSVLLRPLEIADASASYAVITATEPSSPSEIELLDSVRAALGVAGAAVASAAFCSTEGASLHLTAILVPADAGREVLAGPRELGAWRSRWGRKRRALWLRRGEPAVELALLRSKAGQVAHAGCLLARAVLLEWRGAITPAANDALLARALEAVLPDGASR